MSNELIASNTPVARVIAALGDIKTVAYVCDLTTEAVRKWPLPRERGGQGGLVPSRYHEDLLNYAKHHSKALTFADFAPPGVDL